LVSLSVITQEYWVRTKTYLGLTYKQYITRCMKD